MMPDSITPTTNKSIRRLKQLVNALAIAAALSILGGLALYLVIGSFLASTATGFRSLAAAVLPFTIIFYISFFTPMLRTSRRIPAFNLYFVFSTWTLILLGLVNDLYNMAFPLGELLFSFTLAATTWRYGRHSFQLFVSCCYSVVTGSLIYFIFWGLPH